MNLNLNLLNIIFKTIVFFFKNAFVRQSFDVVFYYPAHFNRGNNGINNFFEPFYKICEENRLKYVVFEEPDSLKGGKRNLKNVPFDFIFWLIIILRKIVPLKIFKTFQHREWFIAKLIKPFFFRLFKSKNYIVLSNSMLGFFRGLDINAQLFDYQHGLISSEHMGYINNKSVPEHLLLNKTSLMVYGKGFQNILNNSICSDYYLDNVYPVGYNILTSNLQKVEKKNEIFFSLQFADVDVNFEKQTLILINSIITLLTPLLIKNRIKLAFKHHPRYANHLDLSHLQGLPFIKFYSGELNSALRNCFVHMTMNSTVTFEAAAQGIPTILIKNDLLNPKIYETDYAYPINIISHKDISRLISTYIDNDELYKTDSKAVENWYKKFYHPLNKDLFIDLIKNEKN